MIGQVLSIVAGLLTFLVVYRTVDRSSVEAPLSVPDETVRSFGKDDALFKGESFKSGFIHVGVTFGEMFYWYVPARKAPEAKPFVLWLTGGPGCSSEMAVLSENGPWWIQPDATLEVNPYSWSEVANVIYVDQPLGTGFSKAVDPRNYVVDEHQIAAHMHSFFERFVEKFPEMKEKPFYITGESYAGHYIPAIAHHIMNHPVEGLNFKGVAIGNGWIDPYLQYPAYAEFGYQNKLVSLKGYELSKIGYKTCDELISKGMWPLAMVQCQAITAGILGRKNPYDVRLECEVPPMCYNQTDLDVFLNREDVQSALGVKGKWESCAKVVHALLLGDWVTDMRHKLVDLLDQGYKVLAYHGDKDFICNWVGGQKVFDSLEWTGQEKYAKAPVKKWVLNGKAVADAKTSDNLTFLRVFNAGHMVPMDQPEAALAILSYFLDETEGPRVVEEPSTEEVAPQVDPLPVESNPPHEAIISFA